MKLSITERQLKHIISKHKVEKDVEEQSEPVGDTSTSGDGKPTSGASAKQSGGDGYPEVGKWGEHGQQPERGPDNPTTNDKWGEKGQQPERGADNQLK